MARPHGDWLIHSTQLKYRGTLVELIEDQVTKPDGERGTYATVTPKPGICVIAIEADLRVHLVRQFRYALGRDTLEAVAGGVEESEPPIEAAKRELRVPFARAVDMVIASEITHAPSCAVLLKAARQMS